jgi:peptide subunit release factor 1 (eRF1)
VLYCGIILTDDGKEKRVNIDFEPFKPINTSLYLCDNKFHTEVRNDVHDFMYLFKSSLSKSLRESLDACT